MAKDEFGRSLDERSHEQRLEDADRRMSEVFHAAAKHMSPQGLKTLAEIETVVKDAFKAGIDAYGVKPNDRARASFSIA